MLAIESLIQLGLTPQEARLYVALAGDPRPANALASDTGLARSRVYEVLATLASRGLVEKDANIYRALDLDFYVLRREAELCREMSRIEALRAPAPEPFEARAVAADEARAVAVATLTAADGVCAIRAESAAPYVGLPEAVWRGGAWRILTDDAAWLPEAIRRERADFVRLARIVGPSFGVAASDVHLLPTRDGRAMRLRGPAVASEFRARFEAEWAEAAPGAAPNLRAATEGHA